MNEKEAIEINNTLIKNLEMSPKTSWNRQGIAYLGEINEWLQMRSDIIYLAENPCEEWNTKGNAYLVPYVYKLGKEMQKQAHIELDSFIMWPVNDVVLERCVHYAKLAKKYLIESGGQ